MCWRLEGRVCGVFILMRCGDCGGRQADWGCV